MKFLPRSQSKKKNKDRTDSSNTEGSVFSAFKGVLLKNRKYGKSVLFQQFCPNKRPN